MRHSSFLVVLVITSLLSLGAQIYAEETNVEKAETVKNKVTDSAKRNYRKSQDKACEMVNGKLECTGQRLKHGVQDTANKVKTKATEEKNKVD